jgi:hypothetical protein
MANILQGLIKRLTQFSERAAKIVHGFVSQALLGHSFWLRQSRIGGYFRLVGSVPGTVVNLPHGSAFGAALVHGHRIMAKLVLFSSLLTLSPRA